MAQVSYCLVLTCFEVIYVQFNRFESSNPDNLDNKVLLSYLRLLLEQCVAYFLHHSEIWLYWIQVESQYNTVNSVSVIRQLYKDALDFVSSKEVYLRISYSEFEELQGNDETSKQILKQLFWNEPNGFTFTVYQRYLRRKEGIIAGRKLFSETYLLRQKNKYVGLEVSVLCVCLFDFQNRTDFLFVCRSYCHMPS